MATFSCTIAAFTTHVPVIVMVTIRLMNCTQADDRAQQPGSAPCYLPPPSAPFPLPGPFSFSLRVLCSFFSRLAWLLHSFVWRDPDIALFYKRIQPSASGH